MTNPGVTFGIMADLHVDIIPDPQQRLEAFLEACRRADVDFIIQLGDFCYPEDRKVICAPENMPVNIRNALSYPTWADKDAIISLYRNFEKPAFHVLGNHDCDMCAKEAVLRYYGVEQKAYYSFDMGGFHFVVLDPNYYLWEGEYRSFENGNYFDATGHTPPLLPFLPPEQLEWLKTDLARTQYPAVLFSHQRLTPDPAAIVNAEALAPILKNAPNGVVLAVNGHEHIDNAALVEGIWFWNLNSIGNHWLGDDFTSPGRFGPEIDEKYPNIRYVAPYSQPLFAIVTLEKAGAHIRGTSAEFVGPSPEDLGVYAPGSRYHRALRHGPITPRIEDRFLPFPTRETD